MCECRQRSISRERQLKLHEGVNPAPSRGSVGRVHPSGGDSYENLPRSQLGSCASSTFGGP